MFATRSLLIVGLFCICGVISEKKVCDFNDSKCLTETANLTFEQFIAGVPGVEPSDPLYKDQIEANLPTVNYKIIKGYLSGMKKCKVDLVKINSKDLTYDYHVGCPHLTLDAEYELKGDIGPQYVEGKGTCKIDLHDYHFKFHGKYVSKEKNGKPHINLNTHTLELETNGPVHYDYKNLFNGDKARSDAVHKFANENWQVMDKATRQPAMEAYMDKYINNVNAYLEIVSAADLFSYDK